MHLNDNTVKATKVRDPISFVPAVNKEKIDRIQREEAWVRWYKLSDNFLMISWHGLSKHKSE